MTISGLLKWVSIVLIAFTEINGAAAEDTLTEITVNGIMACASSLQITVGGDLQGSLREFLSGSKNMQGTGSLDASTGFLQSFPPAERKDAYRIYVNCILTILRPAQGSTPSGDIGPSEIEMREAVNDVARGLSAGQSELAGKCARREFQNDPGLALLCLAQIGSGGPIQANIGRFHKIACSASVGQPGYACDYRFAMVISGNTNSSALNNMYGDEATCRGRFVMDTNSKWVSQERKCEN